MHETKILGEVSSNGGGTNVVNADFLYAKVYKSNGSGNGSSGSDNGRQQQVTTI